MNKKKRAFIAIGALIGGIALYMIFDNIFFVSTDNAQVDGNTALLTSRISGFVAKVNVEEGQSVKAGDILVEIDSKDYRSLTHQSESEFGSVQARLHDAETNYKRIQNLYDQGAVSLQQRDSAYATFQELSKKVKGLEAQVQISQNGLNDTALRAPSDGIIAKKAAEVGMLANPGTPLIGFVSNEARVITANFKETDLDRLKIGQKVSISVDAISGKTYHGKILRFNPSTGAVFSLLPPDNATGNFTKIVQRVPARISIEDLTPEDIDLLKIGLSVEVSVRVH